MTQAAEVGLDSVELTIDNEEYLPSDRVADLVEYFVASIVDNPDAMSIEVTDYDDNMLIEVHVMPDDVGKVIGRHGKVIKAIRILARACAAKDELSAEVEVLG